MRQLPVLTKVQNHALATLRKLFCVRHDQMHWLIGLEFPEKKAYAATEMRRLSHIGKAVSDGQYYYWPGCGLNMEMIVSLDIMRRASGTGKPFFRLQAPPCKLAFSLFKDDKQYICSIFFPKPGDEWNTVTAVEELPSGYTAAIFLKDRGHIPRFSIRRPHVFICPDSFGGYEYIPAQVEGGE